MSTPKDEEANGKRGEAQAIIKRSTQDVLIPELLEAFRQEGGHVDVNVLLVQIVQKTSSAEESIENSEKILALAQKYEEHRVGNFLGMANAIIDVKSRDPDEVEKRSNNRVRRWLKVTVGTCAVGSLAGGIFCIINGAQMVVTAIVLAAGAIALSMTGILASGESMSPNDVVRIVGAMRDMLPWRPSNQETPEKKQPPGTSRRTRK